ncbi:HAMP domain-containing protein [Rhodanobacter glycinis]|uniref:histidine kinase n=1 Tax=Rhodanobacter glycinis TaxID=582702 RepID=A0A502F834_9GAMM|nr:ATP-binding protein [Rhodanobacter glycinis]TPG05376.1 HAMP domain-containing protein [Rhodanobacter glycinis]TPG45545.1 HAMP domain-containing protein [Rhodanobacter glycinis]
MRVSIGKRLFFAVLLSIMAVAAIGVELVRWKLSDHPAQPAANSEMDRLDDLVGALSTQYRQHHDWSFLPASPEQRKRWLRDELARVQADQKSGATPLSPSVAYRIGLLDDNEHYLAGAIANRMMVVVASIDRIQRPIVVDGKAVGYLVVAKSQNPDDELAIAFLIEQQRNLAILAAIGVLLSVLAAGLLAAHFRRPVKQLVDGARRLGQGQFATRLSIRRSDELGELADTFNQVAARLQDTEHWRQQWVADTSHELRTPLSVLRVQMEALQDGIRTATPDTIALMLRQVQSLTKLVDELYELARADLGQRQYDKASTDAWLLVQDVFAGFAEKFRVAGLAASIGTVPPRTMVHGDVERLRQVVNNLLENSVRYTDAGGRIMVSGAVVGDELHIAIDDSTPAVPADLLDRLGERFFRVESSRNRQLGGAGLGLALSRHIIEAHDGGLVFAESPLGGLRVILVLPLESFR